MLRLYGKIRDKLLRKVTLILYYYIPILFHYLNPAWRRSDIREEHAGAVTFPNGKYAIYVLWQPNGAVPWYVKNMLGALKKLQVNVHVVLNHKPTDTQLATLQGLSAKVLVRRNKGLDFGAYKDAVLDLIGKEERISRLILLNDSVYVFEQGLVPLVEQLLSEQQQVVAAYENWELHYHFQSFCLALSEDVVADPRFVNFWRRYRPIPIRRWCIDHGEVKLSEQLRKIATRYKICYRINDLLDLLEAEDNFEHLLLHREFVPVIARKIFPSDDLMDALSTPNGPQRKLILRRTKERITAVLILFSQVHTGAFFFPKYLASPFLKRDLVYRGQFNLYEVERMLTDLGVAQLPLISDDIRRRGTGLHFRGFKRRRFDLGLI
jgi:rhamnan synthesis protein F